MKSAALMAGIKGCDFHTGAGTFTAPTGKKIKAIGFYAATEITSYKYTSKNGSGDDLSESTVSNKGWMGSALDANGATAYIPLDHLADKIVVASGSIFVYFQ
jgi:hypothetical protein